MDSFFIVWEESELKNISGFAESNTLTPDTIKRFATLLIKNASARTNIRYEEIVSSNKDFFDYLEKLENSKKIFSTFSEEFEKLCNLLKVPVIKNNSRSRDTMALGDVRERREEDLLNYDYDSDSELLSSNLNQGQDEQRHYTHIDCLSLFNKLSAEEKIKFILEFQNVEIKLTPSEIVALKAC